MKIINKKKRLTGEDIIIDTVVYTLLIGLSVVTFYPMWHVVVASFSSSTDLAANPGILLWPRNIAIQAYEMVFRQPLIMSGFRNIIIVLVLALPINIVMTTLCGYFLACENMMWKKLIAGMVMFTMFFGGGLVPGYLNIKSLRLLDTIWVLILPSALNVYNAIICKTAIEGIPKSLSESAYIDGANDIQVIFKIILPLIKPTLAVLILYYGVAHWNSWFEASIYITKPNLLPVQNIIRSVLMENSILGSYENMGDEYNAYADAIKYSAIVITTVPILCIYPMLQKHFTKGVMIGAVKG